MVETQFSTKILTFQSDWGEEYRHLSTFFSHFGILHCFSCPSIFEQNERTKCKNKHVVEDGLSLLTHASMSLKYWPYAFRFAMYFINHLPICLVQKSPFEYLCHWLPNYSIIHIFGSSYFPLIRPFNSHKL